MGTCFQDDSGWYLPHGSRSATFILCVLSLDLDPSDPEFGVLMTMVMMMMMWWQCGTQNEGPRKKSLQLSTAEHWEPVGFQEKRAARNSGIGGCGQQGLCDLLANARSARRLILFFDGCGIVQVDLAMGSMIVLRSVGEKTGHLYHLCSSCSQIWCIALNCYNLMCYSA